MELNNLIQKALEDKIIEFSDDFKYVHYLKINKKRNYTNPEEKVQLDTYLKLIYDYGYPIIRIQQFVTVTMGSTQKEADIVVYNDDICQSPFIIIECKKEEISESEFIQAIEQAFSYAIAIGANFVWTTSGILDAYHQVDKTKPKQRVEIADIPSFGANTKQIPIAKYYQDGINEFGNKAFDLKEVTEADLTRIFQQAHQALWGGGELNPSQAFDELDKLIFCKIQDEKNANRVAGSPYDFQIWNTDTPATLYTRISNLYQQYTQQIKNANIATGNIDLSPEKLHTIVKYLQAVNLSETDLDSKGRAFETFLGSYFRGEFGQYFTPRVVVQFIVDVLPITNNSMVLDTSCGSGGFLLYALDKVRKQADKNFPNHKTDVKQHDKHKRYWHNFAEHNLFGIEISAQISMAAKMNMIIHDDGHTNVIQSDGLVPIVELNAINAGFKPEHFDFIITNPPFGSTVKQTEKAYMQIKEGSNPTYDLGIKMLSFPDNIINPSSATVGRENQATEILFIEQCYKFLKPHAYLGIVIPDGILTNSSLQYVRDWIEEHFRIVAVVSLPQTTFTHTGAGVKSSVLFLRKYPLTQTQQIQAAKIQLQEKVVLDTKIKTKLEALEAKKKEILKQHKGFNLPQWLINDPIKVNQRKEIEKTEEFKTWKSEVASHYTEQKNEVYELAEEQYQEQQKQSLTKDYPIFMAIAEHIGYDATGKPIPQNDLPTIKEELIRFIEAIEKGTDGFFG